jgi:hypothetical protein
MYGDILGDIYGDAVFVGAEESEKDQNKVSTVGLFVFV